MSKPTSIEKTNEALINNFLLAFKKCLGESAKEEAFQLIANDGPMLIKFENEIYKVDSLANFEAYARATLTLVDEASTLSPEHWILLAEEVHLSPDFISALFAEFNGVKEYEILNTALNLSNNAGKSEKIFWSCLYNMGEFDVYPKAIITASRIYNIDVLVDEFVELIVSKPTEMLIDMKDDFFQTIYLEEIDEDGEAYYIYRVYPDSWS
jgi:hypothetical protein